MPSTVCFICDTHCAPSPHPQTTRSTGSNIVDLLEEFLGFPLDYELPELRIACPRCMDRFNVYDDAIQAAKRAQAELTEIYLDVVCKKSNNQHNAAHSPHRRWSESSVSIKEETQDASYSHSAFENISTKLLIVCKCNEEFASNINYWNHNCGVKEHVWICDICHKTYQTKKGLRVHLNLHSKAKTFACQICGKHFTQVIGLKRHLPLHTGEKPYQCEICGKQFVHAASFRLHVADHDGNAKKKECNICGLKLLSNSHLERHMRVHSGDKPFACPVCGKTFAERYNMKSHWKKSHQPNDESCINVL